MSTGQKQEKKRTRVSSSDEQNNEQTINYRFDNIEKLLSEHVASIHEDISETKQEVLKLVSGLREEVSSFKSSLETAWVEIEDLKSTNKELQEKISNMTKENCDQSNALKSSEDRLRKLEDYSRRENIRFYNIPENEYEDCLKIVTTLFEEVGGNNDVQLHAAHRVGPRSNHRPRPILGRFVSRQDRDYMWDNKWKLRDTDEYSRVYLDEDLSSASARIRKRLREALKNARQKTTEKCYLNGFQLKIGQMKYTVDNLPGYLLSN